MKLLKTITATKKSCKIIKANNCYQMKLLKPTKKKKNTTKEDYTELPKT